MSYFNYKDYIALKDLSFSLKDPYISLRLKKGKILPAHFFPLNRTDLLKGSFKQSYIKLLNIPLDSKMRLPTHPPKISQSTRKNIESISPLNKIILYMPEANSSPSLPIEIFNAESSVLNSLGYKVIVNTTRLSPYHNAHTINLHLSLEDIVALSLECRYTISMRSGFCDLVARDCHNLKVYYLDSKSLEFYSLNGLSNSVNEVIIESALIPKEALDGFLEYRFYKRISKKGVLNKLKMPFTLYKIYRQYKPVKSKLDSIESKRLTLYKNTYEFYLGKSVLDIYKLNIFDFFKNIRKIKHLPRINDILQIEFYKEWKERLESNN